MTSKFIHRLISSFCLSLFFVSSITAGIISFNDINENSSFASISNTIVADTCSPSLVLADTFVHRVYSILYNDAFIRDSENIFQLMQRIGLNELSIRELFIIGDWPLDIEYAIDEVRKKQIIKLIDDAHQHDIKVLSEFDFSGFNEIIKSNPGLSCSQNTKLVCPNNPNIWKWQKRIIDYLFSFPIDGISIQCHLARCKECKELNKFSDVAYHAISIDRVAEYVKQNYPTKVIGINSSGLNLGNSSDLLSIAKLTKNADYLIDVNNTIVKGGNLHMCNMVRLIAPCSYGVQASPSVQSPPHWESDKWFLPMIRKRSQNLKQYFKRGARAIENQMQMIQNPGDEVSLILAARLEKDPGLNEIIALENILTEIYQPKDSFTLQYLTDLFLKAEDVYFENIKDTNDLIILQTPLLDSFSSATYIKDHMSQDAMKDYKKNLCVLRRVFASLMDKINNTSKLNTIIRCIDNVINDVNTLTISAAGCTVAFSKETAKNITEHSLRISIAYLENQGEIKLQIYNPQGWHTVGMKIKSINGKIISDKEIILVPGINEYSVTETGLTDGFYVVEIIDPVFKKQSHLKLFVE